MLPHVTPGTGAFVVAPVDRLKCVRRNCHPSCNKQQTLVTVKILTQMTFRLRSLLADQTLMTEGNPKNELKKKKMLREHDMITTPS